MCLCWFGAHQWKIIDIYKTKDYTHGEVKLHVLQCTVCGLVKSVM